MIFPDFGETASLASECAGLRPPATMFKHSDPRPAPGLRLDAIGYPLARCAAALLFFRVRFLAGRQTARQLQDSEPKLLAEHQARIMVNLFQ